MTQQKYPHLIVEKKGPVGYITINRPEKRNALVIGTGGTIEQIQQACYQMRDDPEVKAFVIQGAGDCFCSGFDLSRYDDGIFKQPEVPKSVEWVVPVKDEPLARYARDGSGNLTKPESNPIGGRDMFWDCLWDNPKPSIAIVHSFCFGAGLWLVNKCDVVYAAPTSIFAYPPIRYGASVVLSIVPPYLLGRRLAMKMALTGQAINAEEALRCGLVTKVVSEDKIHAEVDKLAMSIATVPPATHMFSKRAINNYYEGLGLLNAERFGSALVNITENSAAPGHYLDFFELVRQKGLRQGLKEQREKWGGLDETMENEVKRLAAKQGKKK